MGDLQLQPDEDLINCLESFIKKTKENNINLILSVSPQYYSGNNIMMPLHTIAEKYNVPVTDYYNDSIFVNNRNLFHDVGHLNEKGAKLFSEKISEDIQCIFNIKNSYTYY